MLLDVKNLGEDITNSREISRETDIEFSCAPCPTVSTWMSPCGVQTTSRCPRVPPYLPAADIG